MIASGPSGAGWRALPRRVGTCGALGLALTVWAAGLPLWLLLAGLVDLFRGRAGRMASVRCLLFIGLYLVCEAVGVIAAAALWLGMLGASSERFLAAHYALQRRWGSALVRGALWLFSKPLVLEGADLLDGRPILLFPRHTSLADGALVQPFVCGDRGYRFRYVLKQELSYDPCLDIVGHRLPNAFVRRDGADSAREVARVTGLLDGLGRGEGVLLFPEGTRNTPVRRAKALARLEEGDDEAVLARVRPLRHLLPPRPGGAVALLTHNPGADVVLLGHTGLEGATRLWDFMRGGIVGSPLHLRFWRYPASEVPTDPKDAYLWLLDRWAELDAWIDAQG